MLKRVGLIFCAVLLLATVAAAQQPEMQPLTFFYEYTVRPGKEADFMTLVETVGGHVRDKLMAEGVILAWGIDVPVLRGVFGTSTHTIWFAVADWSGIQKVHLAMEARLAELAAQEAAANEAARRRGQRPTMTTAERANEVFDSSKTRDWITRDLIFAASQTPPPAGTLPWTRYFFAKVHPGKSAEYRAVWEKYNKPVLDRLVANGTVLAYGFAVEEVRTEGSFTHFSWVAVKEGGAFDAVRNAFMADRAGRSQEERDAISAAFTAVLDGDSSRSLVDRAIIFKVSQ
jgi:hypothetical protein